MSIDWDQAPLRDLIAYIVDTHHAYLHAELPRLRETVDALRILGTVPAQIDAISELLESLNTDLVPHLMKEEQVLFPCILNQEASPVAEIYPFGSFRVPIEAMEEDHVSVLQVLSAMRDVTENYRHESAPTVGWDGLISDLEALDRDLMEHIRLENDILHPRTLDLERDRERG